MKAAQQAEIENLLRHGYVLVEVVGYYWLLKDRNAVLVNCNSVKKFLRDGQLKDAYRPAWVLKYDTAG